MGTPRNKNNKRVVVGDKAFVPVGPPRRIGPRPDEPLGEVVEYGPARSITLVLEACFSGASQAGSVVSKASPVYLKAKTPAVPKNVTVIAAGAPDQMASWEEDSSHSLFTKYFLKGMSGEADKGSYGNGDGKVDYNELERYLKDTLTYNARRYYGRDQVARIVVGGNNP